MEKAIKFIKEQMNKKVLVKQIRVYGWQNEYDYTLVSGVGKFLFEEFKTIENLAPISNENRPGDIKPRYYVTVHDTGDASTLHTASFWSEAVKSEGWEQGKYACSYQYVVGNDGTYHNIPDNEVAWHAGDTTKYDYKLYDSGVSGNNENPLVTISLDGYYEIDGVKSKILAPRVYKEKDGNVVVDRPARTEDINDQGVLCKLIDGVYYIGETYFNSTYMLIANRGGNNNSIGIESCINEGSNIYYTWQLTSKLVANLLYNNNLTIKDVKQHHYYSGKNCPQTMRMNNMWNHVLELIEVEYQALLLQKEGYKFKLITDSPYISSNGIVTLPKQKEIVKYQVEIEKDEERVILDFIIDLNNY